MNKYQSFKYKTMFFDILMSLSFIAFFFLVDDVTFFTSLYGKSYDNVFGYSLLSMIALVLISVIGVVRINNFNYIATQKLSENDVHINDYDEFISRAAYLNPNFDNRCSNTVVRDYNVDEMREVFHLLKMESKNDSEYLCKFHYLLSGCSHDFISRFINRVYVLDESKKGITLGGVKQKLDYTLSGK